MLSFWIAYTAQGVDVAVCTPPIIEFAKAWSIPNQVSLAGTTWPRRVWLLLADIINNTQMLKLAYNTPPVAKELPVSLQAIPQTVVIVTDSQTQLLSFSHPALLWQEVDTLHPVVPPLKHTPVISRRI